METNSRDYDDRRSKARATEKAMTLIEYKIEKIRLLAEDFKVTFSPDDILKIIKSRSEINVDNHARSILVRALS